MTGTLTNLYALIKEKLNEKVLTLKDIPLTRRLISEWQADNLIDPTEGKKWRRFSLLDVLWIQLIADLREFGLSHSKIKQVKNDLFNQVDENGDCLLLRETINALAFKVPCLITVDRYGSSTIHHDQDLIKRLQEGEISHHLLISLNDVVSGIDGLEAPAEFREFSDLSKDELALLAIVRDRKYLSIKIKMKDGRIDLIEGIEHIDTQTRIIDLLKEGRYQDIELKQENGKVVHVKRTTKRKL